MKLQQLARFRFIRFKRSKIVEALARLVQKRLYDSSIRAGDWKSVLERHRPGIIDAASDELFELQIRILLAELGSSHVGFYHEAMDRSTAKMAICANYVPLVLRGEEHWVFQDVHEGGPAFEAGIRPGDALLSVEGRAFRPPEHPDFPVDATIRMEVLSRELEKVERKIRIPKPVTKRGQLPYVLPHPIVMPRRLSDDLGYMRVLMYPGAVGVEVSNEISQAILSLYPVRRLIVDLRGNTGGGIGVLRMMSLLTPDKIQVGLFTKGNAAVGTAEPKRQDFALDRIPRHKWELIPLTLQFTAAMARPVLKRHSPVIAIVTEGLGPQLFHGRIVLLINRHTASANEMLVAFARENGLATIVGEPTPGRVLGGKTFKLPYGYRVAMPVGEFRTSEGANLEGTSTYPDVQIPFDPDEARAGVDVQLQRAIEVALAL